ncbi:MAG: TonB-dependent receptor [Chitinophagaceae bacterium]|nr:TonB-dependent receptor [Chitinophagaceae bacterium]
MIKTLRLLAVFLMLTQIALGQASNAGEIYGRVTDEAKKGLDFATVRAFQGGVLKGGSNTDENGNFKIKPLSPGRYDIIVSYAGYVGQELKGVIVGNDQRVQQDFVLEKKTATTKKDVVVSTYRIKLIDASDPGKKAMSKEQIKQTPSVSTGDFASMQAGVYQRKAGDAGLSVGGDRGSGTLYMIDGMMIRGGRNVNLPVGSIDQLNLISNGMSAQYGNATGGIVGITTRGIQSEFGGSLQAQHSVEGYSNNLISLDLAGPFYSVKKNGTKIPKVGFVLNVAATYDKDNNPYIYKYNRLKPEVLKRIQDQPLVANPNGDGNFVEAAEMVTANDFEKIKARENGQAWGLNYLGKLDFQPTEKINFTLGSYFVYNNGRGYAFTNSLFAPEANSISKGYSARGYARLTQRLGKSQTQEKQGDKKSAISNAYYALQFTYQKDYSDGANPDHDRNIFDYGYVGKYQTHRTPFYTLDTAKGGYQGIKYLGDVTDSVTFTPGGINPLLENYTKAVYADERFDVRNLTQLQGYGGLRNGDGPSSAYSLWTGPGAQIGSYSYSEADQITLNLDASFDIEQGAKNTKRKDPITHNIKFGMGYDQRTSRAYSLGASGLWNLMRLITNRQIQNLDLDNPIFVVGGQNYTLDDLNNNVVQFSPFDTIKYDRLYVGSDQARFDKELRTKLYGSETNKDIIDIDNLDPKSFSLDMFSADDLLNDGNDVVSYWGYDYLGKKVNKQPSFNDFWTKKDARGDYSRPVGAFRPIYMFGYILDKFSYKDLLFNIGVRVDRYDANQKVLKDPYSLYGVRKAGDIKEGTYLPAKDKTDNDKEAPNVSNFDKDYVVYVDNNQSQTPTVVGYRKGDTWYDPFGKEIADPTVLSSLYAGGLPIQPWLINNKDSIKSATFNPNNSFEDYKPQVTVSPRIQFTFPISDNALFYGNYDVVTQQPSSNNFTTPDDYYFLAERQATINNANMRMEKAVNYSLGYQQKLSKKAALTVEAYYRERKDQIQLQRYILAYPITYQSFGNRDFASTKGMTVKLDFRRSGPIRMNVDYTLQFAEGTGSSTTTQSSLLATGQPNLRTVFPLDFDSRHLLNVTLDYRYEGEKQKGPKVGNVYPFKNAGINFLFRTRSGEPYTRSALATPLVGGDFQSTPIIGTINGSRLPWQFELSTRVDKSFSLGNWGGKKDKEGNVIRSGKPLYVNVYSYITNLLNTRNTLSVYGYTGVGDDDGYLTSPQGLEALNGFQFQQSYRDLYSYRLVNPGNFNNPRRIFIGLTFDF